MAIYRSEGHYRKRNDSADGILPPGIAVLLICFVVVTMAAMIVSSVRDDREMAKDKAATESVEQAPVDEAEQAQEPSGSSGSAEASENDDPPYTDYEEIWNDIQQEEAMNSLIEDAVRDYYTPDQDPYDSQIIKP